MLGIFLPLKGLPNTLYAIEFGMGWPERAASRAQDTTQGYRGGRSSLHSSECRLRCFSWQTLLVPPTQSFKKSHTADSGKENPVPCSVVPSMYHNTTHGFGTLQITEFSKQLLKTLHASAALSLN